MRATRFHALPHSQGKSTPAASEPVSVQVLQRPGRKRAAKSSGGAKPEPQISDATVVVLQRRSARPVPGTLLTTRSRTQD